MVGGALQVGAVLVAVALIPVAVLTVLFRLIDYVGTDTLPTQTGSDGAASVSGDTAAPGTELDRPETGAASGDSPPHEDAPNWDPSADDVVACPACDADNDAEYDRCWNCLERL